ncbi:probable LRR receptor-like serine/threonine-protein kinase At1g06840 [Pyrus x bretschneideri]|uniref:probable LRR receptor-like serine/threonine-protein kinase At1g06840 n=1 Tax=Pyrus x bretschneideri TaxID=225117 RepID=UPI00202DF0BF|nr:probable LRR receptor-like serine/threonine-protein kinase At1g06840 [Pyrus x bretschneideri]
MHLFSPRSCAGLRHELEHKILVSPILEKVILLMFCEALNSAWLSGNCSTGNARVQLLWCEFGLEVYLFRCMAALCADTVTSIDKRSDRFLVYFHLDELMSISTSMAALRAIKSSLVDPNEYLSKWHRGDPCTANWTGVFCYNTTLDDGYLHVQELRLLNMNLSGSLSPELGRLSYMKILLLNGNQLSGSLPEMLGYLPNLERLQIDQNQISGSIPISFANLNKTKHFHMNNNSISGQIPPELSRLPRLVHFLLDNNNLSGYLPPQFSELPSLLILQLDNNNFEGTTIPDSYSDMSKLLKLSLRNCNLQGPIPDLSRIPNLAYIDLSSNQLNGSLPQGTLSDNITTINLSNNTLTGTIPGNFSYLPDLQRLEMQNNNLTNITGSTVLSQNVTVWLRGNPLCSNGNLDNFCGTEGDDESDSQISTSTVNCVIQVCPPPFEYIPVACFCAAPLIIDIRLKSPAFTDFSPYKSTFEQHLTSGIKLDLDQLDITSFLWEKGPRLIISLKLFPLYVDNANNSSTFNRTELKRIMSVFATWKIPDSDLFGPYELLDFILLDPYKDVLFVDLTALLDVAVVAPSSKSSLGKGALAGVILGTIAGAVTLSAIVSLLILRKHLKDRHAISRRRRTTKSSIKIEGVKDFTFGEMAVATNNFSSSAQVGQGGYGKVYKGILADGTVVAIKRAQEGSLQGEKEFLTEIELLSPLHHRNLVSLVGYCDEEGEQMLVYEFMSNGTLRDHLSAARSKEPLGFEMRLRIALGSAKGILYLHTEANPPIFHRDIKATNILLDSKFIAKVADFGLSRLAPVPDFEGTVPAHVSTVVKGTPGYLDPEYFLTHKLTDKSDVYSLGVVFLELLTGMQPISHGKNIVREVNIAFQSGMIFSVIDGRMGSYPSECEEKFLSLALKCCRDETDARPSMAEVVRELENIWFMMPESDSRTSESVTSSSGGKVVTLPPSSNAARHPCVSIDVSGSDLVSGVVPTITPR